MRVVITGVAGFIGSALAAACAERGDDVVGCDSLSDYYDSRQKQFNLDRLRAGRGVDVRIGRLEQIVTPELLDGVDVVYHQAGQPGVRQSWESGFDTYVDANVLATQRLLEVARAARLPRLVVASSSSIYGNAARYPVLETDAPRPFSPYGVTKLAAERLAIAYADNFDMSVAALRYFTVYGPGQRPDMAMHRLIRAALTGAPFPLYGDGGQIRDFTYVGDVVAANLLAASAELAEPALLNVCGGSSVSLADVVALVEDIVGRPIALERRGDQAGDVTRTGGSGELAREVIGWEPATSLRAGLEAQTAWMREWLTHTDEWHLDGAVR